MKLRRLWHRFWAPAWEDLWSKAIAHASRANVHEVHHEWDEAIRAWHESSRWLRAAYLSASEHSRKQLWEERVIALKRVAFCADRLRDSWGAVESVRGRVAS